VLVGLITQNVDLLHEAAGSRRVVGRAEPAAWLEALNPGFAESVGAVDDIEIAPDADAVIERTAHFRTANCWQPDPDGVTGHAAGC